MKRSLSALMLCLMPMVFWAPKLSANMLSATTPASYILCDVELSKQTYEQGDLVAIRILRNGLQSIQPNTKIHLRRFADLCFFQCGIYVRPTAF